MGKRIAIYADDGASDFCVFSTQSWLADQHPVLCRAADVISGRIFDSCDIFIMPGGADLPYCRAQNGTGNAHIRRFVQAGGTYLGICAGAYYGSHEIAYHQGRDDEIAGPRELALIDTRAYGSLPAIAGYYDETLRTAAWTNLVTENASFKSFYHGGCAFTADDPDACILARFADLPDQPAAILEKPIGKGRAILSGVHIETLPAHLENWVWDASEAACAAALAKAVDPARLFPLRSRLINE